MKLLKIMKKFILSIFAALLLVSCETDAPTKLYRVITEDNDTTYINAFRWEIYGDSKQYIIFYQTDAKYLKYRSYVGNVKSVIEMEDD